MSTKNIKKDKNLLSLPFDQYSRQAWASEIIETLRRKQKLRILDVGGYKGKTSEFFPDDDVVVCDLYDIKEPGYVKGDGRSLPFKDKEFDFVVTFDTYEHVPRTGRDAFIAELLRVTSGGVVLAAPFDNELNSVSKVEIDLNEYHKQLYGKEHPWLTEHIEYKIPALSEIIGKLDKLSANYTYINSNHLDVWVAMQTMYLSIDLDDDLRGRVDDVNRYYNAEFKKFDLATEATSYRKVIYFGGDTASMKKIEKTISKPSLEQVTSQTSDIIAYALSVFGRKYADTARHAHYLEEEIQKMKAAMQHYQAAANNYRDSSVVKHAARKLKSKIR